MTGTPIRTCARCACAYDWRKSTSALRNTYCNSLCERAALGFTIDGLLHVRHEIDVTAIIHEASLSLIASQQIARMGRWQNSHAARS